MHTENANYVLIAQSSGFRHFLFHSDELGSADGVLLSLMGRGFVRIALLRMPF